MTGPPQSHFVNGESGLRLHLLRWSERGHPVLLVHGFGDNGWVWAEVAAALGATHAVTSLDLRGHGDSDSDPEQRYGLQSFAEDVGTAVAAMGGQPVALVGHSLGGNVAVHFAVEHPKLVSSLVLVESAPELRAAGVEHWLSSIATAPHVYSSLHEYRRWLRIAYPLATEQKLDDMVAHGLRRSTAGEFTRKLDPCFGESSVVRGATSGSHHGTWEQLTFITAPALVVRAAGSAMLSRELAERTVDRLPFASLRTVDRAGHAVMLDNPRQLSDILSDFLAA